MKLFIVITSLTLVFFCAHVMASDPPDIIWDKTLGTASGHECAFWVAPTSDNGYILTGMTAPDDDEDVWIVRTDSTGNPLWERIFQGSERDYGMMITETADGSFFAIGSSKSSDGDFIQNHGGVDIWAAWLDRDGNTLLMKQYGGSSDEEAGTGFELPDGDYILSGYTSSSDGDVTDSHGGNDAWLLRLTPTGEIRWQKTYGGSKNENTAQSTLMSDGGYILVGAGSSDDAGITGHHTGTDLLLIRTDASGNPIWQRYYGGSRSDWGHALIETSDGNILAAGTTASDDGDVTLHYGATNISDLWVLLLSPDGTILWQKTFGGSYSDLAWGCTENDEGYLIIGDTYSFDGDLVGNREDGDIWLLQLGRDGTLLWDKTLGGSKYETGSSIISTSDGGIALIGYTLSSDGDVSDHQGLSDAWLVKMGSGLSPTPVTPVTILQQSPSIQIFPGLVMAPTDPDNDGLYEDINGNGRLDYQDLIIFYNQIDWIKEQQPVSAFDMNGNGAIEMQDMILLYQEV